ncbi:Uncharacterised protein [uncultured Ruminococcus sp.]|nr:Uncharacterised protein [uncultured Clostridium sp.]SCH61989.1 Uncharacterised protein [uncultured Ruminococcus sp.]
MAYNKAKAEKEWIKWKETEEKKLRELGVDEETIQRLHTYDWAQFNKERRYLQRKVEWSPVLDLMTAQELESPVKDTESLLDNIENTELLRILFKEDKLTINAIFLRSWGYSTRQICTQLGITEYAYYNRIKRLKRKLKKFFMSD